MLIGYILLYDGFKILIIINLLSTNLKTKAKMYRTPLKSIWTHGLQLWGSAKNPRFSKYGTLRLSKALPYISNLTLLNNFNMKTINEEAFSYYSAFISDLKIILTLL